MLQIASYKIIVLFFLTLLLFSGCSNQEEKAMEKIRDSHIDGNVPSEDNFNTLLERDLTKYFKNQYSGEIAVDFELLHDTPAQVGVSLPKYYVWVTVYNDNKKVEQGAARVAAIDKKLFDVTHFINQEQIKQNTDQIYALFPVLIGDKIKEKL